MNYTFIPMTYDYANTIVSYWKYEGAYSIYDYSNEADHMLDPNAWGVGLFAVLDDTGELIGELSIEFLNNAGDFTGYEQYSDHALIATREMWIGLGLRPDRVGQGRGSEFVKACVQYAVARWNYPGDYVRLGVAVFNQRAISAYEHAGFRSYEHVVGKIAGKEYECLYMRKQLAPQ